MAHPYPGHWRRVLPGARRMGQGRGLLGIGGRDAVLDDGAQPRPYWALTAAISFARPCLASAKYIPVLGLV